jgi:hypothetical protein
VPKKEQLQSAKKRTKREKTAGVIVKSISDMRVWAGDNELPTQLEAVEPFTTYVVPYDYEAYPNTDALVLTSHTQLGWIGQMAERPHECVLHVDGKHKTHHGGWLLITFGTHAVEHRGERSAEGKGHIAHTFRPCIYMFTEQQETTECVQLGFECIKFIARVFYKAELYPGLGCADHCKGTMSAWAKSFPDVRIAGCWPHIAWGLSYGRLIPKTHPRFELVKKEMALLHLAQTDEMFDLMTEALGQV